MVVLAVGLGVAQERYDVRVEVNGSVVDWTVDAPASREDGVLVAGERATVRFEGGRLELALADLTTFDLAHVLATEFTRRDTNRYTVSATVRHNDTGWDEYADAFRITSVTPESRVDNGVRELLHPHVNEQPFTRSQSGVTARGTVRVEARDLVDGYGGSAIVLDLSAFPFDNDTGAVRYTVTPTAPD